MRHGNSNSFSSNSSSSHCSSFSGKLPLCCAMLSFNDSVIALAVLGAVAQLAYWRPERAYFQATRLFATDIWRQVARRARRRVTGAKLFALCNV
jgi:hypothetical protein